MTRNRVRHTEINSVPKLLDGGAAATFALVFLARKACAAVLGRALPPRAVQTRRLSSAEQWGRGVDRGRRRRLLVGATPRVHKCQVHFLLPRQACELLLSTPRAQLVHCQPALRWSNSTVPYVLIVTSICAWIRDGRPCLPGACTRVKSEQLKLPTQMNRCIQLSHTRAIPKLCSSFSSNARVKYGDREALSCRSCVLYTS
jgi:hypothetical protein